MQNINGMGEHLYFPSQKLPYVRDIPMMQLSGTKILVTGGTGFIGGHLVSTLLELGADVSVVDIEIRPNSLYVQRHLGDKVAYYTLDIRDKDGIQNLIKHSNAEYIFHLAAKASVLIGYDDPSITFDTNIMGTLNILEGVRKSDHVKGLIVASSDKAYGKSRDAYTEDMPLRGSDPFGVSKSCVDLLCQSYYKTFNTPVAITRFSNVYGEGDLHFDRIIPEICKAVVQKKPFRVRSDGTYRRDYIYIQDVINGYLTLLQHIDTIHGEAYNFSSEDNLSVLEVIDKVRHAAGYDFPYTIVNSAKHELDYQHLIDDKIKKLGWTCKSSFEDVLPNILSWYRSILS